MAAARPGSQGVANQVDKANRYQAQRINIVGEPIGYDPDAPTASAEWAKHHLNRVRDSLPNVAARSRAELGSLYGYMYGSLARGSMASRVRRRPGVLGGWRLPRRVPCGRRPGLLRRAR